MGNEAYIMPFISSANIACGGHTGNADSIKRTIEIAQKHNLTSAQLKKLNPGVNINTIHVGQRLRVK